MATLAAATSLSLPPAPPAQLLDIQSLPSLEKFDSQLLDLIKATSDAGAAGINVMDELQAPDDDLALRRLMGFSYHPNIFHSTAPDDDLALQRLMSLTRNRSHDAFNAFAQQQFDSAAAAEQQNAGRACAGQHLRGQMQHHQLPGHPSAGAGGPDLAALAEYMKMQQQQQEGAAQAEYMNMLAAQNQAAQQAAQDPMGAAGLQGSASLADALAGLHSQGGLNAFMEQLRSDGAMGANLAANFGGNLSAALVNLGLPPVDGPSSAVAQRKRANRGTRLTDIIKHEQSIDDGEGFQNEASIQAAAAAMAAALQGGGGSDSRDSTQSPRAKRRKGANQQSAAEAAAAAAAALGSADSDYEVELHSTSHLHITADMDEETKTKLRREKNRIAARKCRAKKNALMTDLQATLAGLMRKNEEYKLQMVTWHKMFSREVRLREAMKRIIAVMWSHDVAPGATGYTANDIIIGIESGTLDINSVLRSFAAVSAASNGGATPTAAQAAAAGLAPPAPLILNRSTSAANTPRSPAAAAAAAAAATAAMAASAADGGSPVQGLVPQHLLMSHSSHISQNTSHIPHTPHATEQAASMVLNAAGGKGMMAAPNGGVSMGGVAGDAANALGSPISSVAASALVDLAGTGAGGMQGQGFGMEANWGWGMDGGLANAPSQVGPSCITTGME